MNKTKSSGKQNQTKQNRTKHGVCFVLASFAWAWSLSWSVVDVPAMHHWKIRLFLSQQLPIANSFLSVGLYVCWNVYLIRVCAGSVGPVTVSVSSYVRQTCCV